MLYLNIRQTQAQIGMQITYAKLDSHMRPAVLHRKYEAPKSEITMEQPSLTVDTYPSRHSYGYNKHDDFAKQYGQAGISDVQKATSKHTQAAWNNVKNGAKPHSKVIQGIYKRELSAEISKKRIIVVQAIPDPEVHITPIQLHGGTNPGHDGMDIETTPDAEVKYTPGSVETHVAQKADVRQWVTEGHYDIYA